MKFHSNSRTGFKTKQNNNESTEQLDGRGPESRVGLKKDGQCGGWGSGRAQASESPGDPPGQPVDAEAEWGDSAGLAPPPDRPQDRFPGNGGAGVSAS